MWVPRKKLIRERMAKDNITYVHARRLLTEEHDKEQPKND